MACKHNKNQTQAQGKLRAERSEQRRETERETEKIDGYKQTKTLDIKFQQEANYANWLLCVCSKFHQNIYLTLGVMGHG